MERLEPILKQKFWILLGIGMVMTITGWWMATGSLAATIKTRTDVVKGAFGKIPSGEIPNNDWSSQLAARNAEQDRAINYTKSLLWERQRSRMTWPDTVAEFAWQNGYRGEIALAGRENYRTAYGYDVRRVWESVRPFQQLDGSGIVVFGQNERVLPQRTWGTLAPSSAEMWDAQEDLWLLESLLQSIVDVNGGPEATRGDASVHVIEKLELHGGLPPSQRKAGGAAPAGGPGGMSMPAGPGGAHGAGGSSSFGGGGDIGGGGAARGAAVASADFDWREELGDDGSSNARGLGGGATGPMGGSSSSSMSGPSAAHSMGGPASGPGGAAAASTVRRYIEDDKALPYVSRGFYMTVIMDHRKIPSLVAELSASEKSAWPVEIVRIQMVRLHDDDVDSRGIPGSGGGYGPPAGRPNFSLNSLSSGGGNSSGFPGPAGFESDSASAVFGDPSQSGPGNQNAAALSQVAAATAALEGALQDPFMARVAICGIITLYREVKPEPVAATAGQPAPGTAAPAAAPAAAEAPANPDANPAAAPEGTAPANPAAPEAKPGEAAEAPAAAPATTPEKATPEPTAPDAAPKTPPGGNGST